MQELIAVVATAVIVNGERIVIAPGHPIPDLSDHDAVALKGSGAALDPKLDAEAREVVDAAALSAAAEFQAARLRVQGEARSIKPPEAPTETQAPTETLESKAPTDVAKASGDAKATRKR